MLCRKSLNRVKAVVLALTIAGFAGLGVSSLVPRLFRYLPVRR